MRQGNSSVAEGQKGGEDIEIGKGSSSVAEGQKGILSGDKVVVV